MKCLSAFLLVLFFSITACSSGNTKYRDLEQIDAKPVLKWVEEESALTKKKMQSEPGFEKMQKDILTALESKDKILYGTKRGEFFYNFWKDAENQRGLWRRTKFSSYSSGRKNLKWEKLISFDELSKKENVKWVFKGTESLPAAMNSDVVIVKLSNGGKDAFETREFSLKTKKFLDSGLNLPEAKYSINMVDKDTLLVASNADKDMVTRSGYPRELKFLKRGSDLSRAKVLLTIPADHTAIWSYSMPFSDTKNIHIVEDSVDFFSSNKYIYQDGELVKVPVPTKTSIVGAFKNKIFLSMKSDEQGFTKGEIIFTEISNGNEFSKLKSFFKPANNQSFESMNATKDYILLVLQEDVVKKAYRYYPLKRSKWDIKKLSFKEEVSVLDADLRSNNVLLKTSGFLTPDTVEYYDLRRLRSKVLQQEKSYFDSKDFVAKQEWAVSKDGARIPFFIVHKKDMKLNSKNKTIMYGYGGFEISLSPFYLKTRVPHWVAKGHVFVLANIRGGGEFGPAWHQAAQKFNKKKSYEDFAAISERLEELKITSPKHLGISGGSNGGLLVGASSVLFPSRYGAAFSAVPLLDMLRYDQLLVGSSWIPEYGDPKIKEERDYLKTYSPFHNVFKDGSYPKMFFYTSTFDDRVHPAHARKMYSKMKDQGHEVYYYENSEGGHAGASNLKQRALKDALKFTFFEKALN
jgi:prolyl oligopeptidase